ncbi:MAG: hypothetical protein Q7J20_02770 [Candidatus Nitrotoga sp.]|nr:hypothetical protein [Candidatus Nitrotoga sp.]MDO9446822.1 hypothetical protein [Candidatus Nitrotoga sp.]
MSFDQLRLGGECQALEFKTIFETGRLLRADLEQALINKLQRFLRELGKRLDIVARQMSRAEREQLWLAEQKEVREDVF